MSCLANWCVVSNTIVGLARTIYIRCIYEILAGKSANIRSYTVYIYGSGQPYTFALHIFPWSLGVLRLTQFVSNTCCVIHAFHWSLGVLCRTHLSNTLFPEALMAVPVPSTWIGLARTAYIHRIWPYIWLFPCQKYRIYTVYIWFWPTLHMNDPSATWMH